MRNKIHRFWLRFHDKYLRGKKFKFVVWLDAKFPGKYCWADCVTWAYGSQRLNPFKIESSAACKQESIEHQHGLCYCGGWNNGVCFAQLPKEEQEKIIAERESEKVDTEIPF